MFQHSGHDVRDNIVPSSSRVVQAQHDGNANHLAQEKSPYLLQHARNPVAWYPWGEEAFVKARRENKPIFLSVGYSTCHWCHVMERESFENSEIAGVLNEHFVSIKVDREERPDVDRVYMAFVQATTGSGGWPMSVWLTPDLKPFIGGTYYPPEDYGGRPGFRSLLLRIAEAWKKDQQAIVGSAGEVIRQLQHYTTVSSSGEAESGRALLDAGYRQIKSSYDPRHGGFGGAPKNPRPVILNIMLRYYARTGAQDALEMSLFTLHKMAEGGMHDHLGGGFHRYSVDDQWHVPHFEKMLYDQAQLACSYLEAWQITGDGFYAGVARDVLNYVLQEMTGDEGQFYSAEDADSEGLEGKFYLWEEAEINTALGIETAEIFNYHYGVEPRGNAPSDPHGMLRNQNILIVRHTLAETAARFSMTVKEARAVLDGARSRLLQIRAQRPRPHRDDKTLTAWNGLMISAFARAAQVLAVEERTATAAAAPKAFSCLAAAEAAAHFIETRLYDPKNGRLWRRYREGEAAIDGFADDYAYLVQGLIDLYEASFNIKWLTWAIALQKQQDALFWDQAGGGYFSTTGKDHSVLLRMKEDYDGAEPSANSVAGLNLLRLAHMTGDKELSERAGKLFSTFAGRLQQTPGVMPQMLAAWDFSMNAVKQIIIAGKPQAPDTRALLQQIHRRFIPNRILLLADGSTDQKQPAGPLAWIDQYGQLAGKATLYLCENYVCRLPATDPAELAAVLDRHTTKR